MSFIKTSRVPIFLFLIYFIHGLLLLHPVFEVFRSGIRVVQDMELHSGQISIYTTGKTVWDSDDDRFNAAALVGWFNECTSYTIRAFVLLWALLCWSIRRYFVSAVMPYIFFSSPFVLDISIKILYVVNS